MRKRVTKKIAQERVNAIGREVTIVDWNSTNKPCKIRCNKCGVITEVKEGYYVYTESSRYFRWKDCIECKVRKSKEEKQFYCEFLIDEGKLIDRKIELARQSLKKYLNKEVIASELQEYVNEIIGIENMSFVKFNYSVLDRIADYEMIKMNKFGKKGYVIKRVYDVALAKTKERIELEEKFKDRK